MSILNMKAFYLYKAFDLFKIMRADHVTIKFGIIYSIISVTTILIYIAARLVDKIWPAAIGVSDFIALSSDGGFAELIGYAAAFIAASNFIILYLDRRFRFLLFLSILMLFIGFDDSMSYHERMGRYIASAWNLPSIYGLRPQDFGEILAWFFAGIVVSSLLIWSLLKLQPGDVGILLSVFAPFVLLVVSGIIFDMIHVLTFGVVGEIAFILEDGGELISLTIIAIISVGISRNIDLYYNKINQRIVQNPANSENLVHLDD